MPLPSAATKIFSFIVFEGIPFIFASPFLIFFMRSIYRNQGQPQVTDAFEEALQCSLVRDRALEGFVSNPKQFVVGHGYFKATSLCAASTTSRIAAMLILAVSGSRQKET